MTIELFAGGHIFVQEQIMERVAMMELVAVELTHIPRYPGEHQGLLRAIYRMLRLDGGVMKSFEVRFVIDGDGLWRIQGF